MLLNDIGKLPTTAFRKINQHLNSNYGFKIAEDTSDETLVSIMEHIQDEITELKIKGDDSKDSPEISKRLLVLEGIKTLREFAFMQFQSPKLNTVVNNLVDYVVDTFEISGMQQADFDKALNRAMEEYRSSRYRFPDHIIEQRVRDAALSRIHASSNEDITEEMPEIDDSTLDEYIEQPGAQSNKPDLALAPVEKKDEPVPMVRDPRTGEMVADPFAKNAAERRKGIVMKEHENLVKNLRRLLETEVSQAEVMMAAKGFAQELQEMVEKIGRLQNEDLPPVTDQMRETYGMDSASAFQTQIYGALQSVMDALYTAKGQVDDAVENMASTGQVSASIDMDKDVDVGMDAAPDDGLGDDSGLDAGQDLDNLADLDTGDDFGGAEEEEPLGRSKKMESVQSLQRKVLEMQKLVAKAAKLKESKKRA